MLTDKFKRKEAYVLSSDDGVSLSMHELSEFSVGPKAYVANVLMAHESKHVVDEYYCSYPYNGRTTFLYAKLEDLTKDETGLLVDANGNVYTDTVSFSKIYLDEDFNPTMPPVKTAAGAYVDPNIQFDSFKSYNSLRVASSEYLNQLEVVVKYSIDWDTYEFIYFTASNVLCGPPMYSSAGLALEAEYDEEYGSAVTNEVYDSSDTSTRAMVAYRKPINTDKRPVAINVRFEVDDEWVDGDIKHMVFNGTFDPIKLNGDTSYQSASINKAYGNIIATVENESSVEYIIAKSYLDNHVKFDDTMIAEEKRVYHVELMLRRMKNRIILISSNYRVPYYVKDSVNNIYSEGEFTFKSVSWGDSGDVAGYDNKLSNLGSHIFDYDGSSGKYKVVSLTLNCDWMPNTGTSQCDSFNDLFMRDINMNDSAYFPSKMYLEIETSAKVTAATAGNK